MRTAEADRRSIEQPQAREIQQSLTTCWKEGIVAQVMIGILDYYLVPFALLLKATTAQIGLLTAIPNLLSSVSQLVAVRAVEWAGDRKRLLMSSSLTQALFLLPIGLLAYAASLPRVAALIGFVAVYKVSGSLIGPAWGSLVSEYLPPNRRGHYFGWRSRIVGVTGLLNLAFWGAFLYYFRKIAGDRWAFVVLFATAGVARLMSHHLLSKMANLPFQRTDESDFTFWMFIRRFRESNFVKFIIYVASITFTTQIAAPFFSVHLLRDLHYNYLQYTAINLASVISGLASFPLWGRHADAVGNVRIMKITGLALPIIPLLWVLAPNLPTLFLVEVFGGAVWGGFNLCVSNFIYDAVSPPKRVRCISYFNLINGAAIFAGTTLGGTLANHLPPILGLPLAGLFLLSGAGRLACDLFFSRYFEEVRDQVKPISSGQLFFSMVGIRPFLGRNSEQTEMPFGFNIRFGKRRPSTRRAEERPANGY